MIADEQPRRGHAGGQRDRDGERVQHRHEVDERLRDLVQRFVDGPNRDGPCSSEISRQSTDSIQAYAKGQTAIALLNGAVMGLAARVLDIPLPFSIFLVNFIGAYIPYIGAFVGGAFAALLVLAVGGIGLAIAIIVVALAMNLLLENAVQPKLVGDKMDLHPLLVLLATVAGGLLAGMVGLILAAPIAAIALNVYRDLRAAGYFD